MENKELVTIVTVGEPKNARMLETGLDPKTAITRQGVPAEWVHVPRRKGGIAETLLTETEERGAELLVMGAYEHSKFREDLFGGVTHDVMAETNVPVFLAH